jgi:Na+/phosphate symporter
MQNIQGYIFLIFLLFHSCIHTYNHYIIYSSLHLQEETNRSFLEERDRLRERELDTARAALRDAQREVVECTKAAGRKQREIADLQKEINEKVVEGQQKKEEEIAMYKKRCLDAEQAMKVCLVCIPPPPLSLSYTAPL